MVPRNGESLLYYVLLLYIQQVPLPPFGRRRSAAQNTDRMPLAQQHHTRPTQAKDKTLSSTAELSPTCRGGGSRAGDSAGSPFRGHRSNEYRRRALGAGAPCGGSTASRRCRRERAPCGQHGSMAGRLFSTTAPAREALRTSLAKTRKGARCVSFSMFRYPHFLSTQRCRFSLVGNHRTAAPGRFTPEKKPKEAEIRESGLPTLSIAVLELRLACCER